ncbi:MAG: fibronectin type III domain-containing protein [Armatimonadota bacterium]
MSRIRNSRATGPLVVLLATALLAPLVTPVLAQGGAAAGAVHILVFPLEDESSAPRDMSDMATRCLARALDDTEKYTVEVFSRHSPTARRKVDEGVLGSEDIVPPYGPRTAVNIGRAFDADEVLLGTVVDRQMDEATNVVAVTITGRTFVVAANVEPTTGTPLEQITADRSFGVTGSSRERRIFGGDPSLLDKEACDDAGAKIAEVLAGEKPPEPEPVVPKKKGFWQKWGWVVAVLGVGIIVAAAQGNDRRAQAPPAPRNLVWSKTVTDEIVLQWDPPLNPPGTVLRYRIDRSLNNAAWQRIDGGVVLGGATDFTDTAAPGFPPGTVKYRIRAEYAGGGVSAFVGTGDIPIL